VRNARPERDRERDPAPDHAVTVDGRLEIASVTKSFGTHHVLRGLTLSVAPGTTTAIVGPSGSGKSTLLRLIAGFERPDAGTIGLGGRALAGDGSWVPAHQRNVGYVAQDGALFPHLSVGQNIAFGLDASTLPDGRQGVKARVAELLAMVSLDASLAERRPHQISGGQQQRVALARALAREPRLMLLDESFSALDAGLRVATRRTVAQVLNDARITTVLVTHDQAEALSFADQVAVIRDGILAQVDSPLTVYTRPADRATAEFLGDAVLLDAWVDGTVATCSLGRVRVAQPPCQGRCQLMLRPEQIRLDDTSPVRGVVLDMEYFGPETTVRLQLAVPASTANEQSDDQRKGAETISVRHWNASTTTPGADIGIRVDGEAIAFPPDLECRTAAARGATSQDPRAPFPARGDGSRPA